MVTVVASPNNSATRISTHAFRGVGSDNVFDTRFGLLIDMKRAVLLDVEWLARFGDKVTELLEVKECSAGNEPASLFVDRVLLIN